MTLPDKGRPETQEEALRADFRQLEEVWLPLPEAELPTGLLEDTLARLRREGLLEARVVRVDWRQRLAAAVGIAAALLAVAGLWQARERLSPLGDPALSAAPSWAEGLVLSERFESASAETEVRLARVSGLLAEEGEKEAAGAEQDAGELRDRLDRLAEELEAF